MAIVRRLLVVLVLGLLLAPMAFASGVPKPDIPKAKGLHCVRNTEWMRRNHMKLLMHERYLVVHKGIRNEQETLPGCMSCHVRRLPDGHYPSVTSKKFFCNSCHTYVGVRIDCFSCHTNRPGPALPSVAADNGMAVAEGDIVGRLFRSRQAEEGAK